MKVVRQREKYLEKLKQETRRFWSEIVAKNNEGISAKDIAKQYINPRTGKNYSRQHIHAILKTMAEEE